MQRLDLTLADLPANLALDEALLLDAEAGRNGEVLRFWHWPTPAVVLGAGGRIAADVDLETCRRAGVPLARRSSGGGTVLLGAGCLIYSLILRFDRSRELLTIPRSQAYILGIITAAINRRLPGTSMDGYGDIVFAGRKCGGSAQQRKRDHLLFHGTILYDFDLAAIGRFLREPPKQPKYRASRPHNDFVTNLPFSGDEIQSTLSEAWDVKSATSYQPPKNLDDAVAERFGNEEWIHRF